MNISTTIFLKGFNNKKIKKKISIIFKKFSKSDNQLLKSLSKSYKNSYSKKFILRFKKFSNINLIGMGGSSLGARSIYSFLRQKIKKNFFFIDNLQTKSFFSKFSKNDLNLIISKSGNTLETIANVNFYLKKNQKNILITENKKSYLNTLAKKLKAEIVHHNNFIGGRYSVLSEVGMLPADLMGLSHLKFRQYNNLIKNKKFINSLLLNVSSLLDLLNKKNNNSVILNYDEKSCDLFYWYQQLVAESLGKKGKGLFPVVSNMPKDNHSLMQLYLAGPQNKFFTLFFVKENLSEKIDNSKLLKTHFFLKNKTLSDIKFAQFEATQSIFKRKKIPFRSFLIKKRNEQTLGELFTFFILETILLGRAMNVNPFDQPAVELIKTETRRRFIKS